MAYLYRLGIFCLVLCIGTSAFALVTKKNLPASPPQSMIDQIPFCSSANSGFLDPVRPASCGIETGANGVYPCNGVGSPNVCFVLRCLDCPGANSQGYIYSSASVPPGPPVCPGNSTDDIPSGLCACNSGFVDDSAKAGCLPQDNAACKALEGQSTYISGPGPMRPLQVVCGSVGCEVKLSGVVATLTDKATGAVSSQGDGTITSKPCTPGAPSAGGAGPMPIGTPTSCKGAYGQVNGVSVCIGMDPNTNVIEKQVAGPSTTASAPTSGASAPSIAGAPAGTVSKDVSTSCVNENCTTTTTYRDASGNPLGSESETKPQPNFCKDNPTISICKTGSFSGTCNSAPSCDGDAVMCAVARSTFETNCALNPAASSESQLYGASKLLTGDQTAALPGNSTVAITSANFDQTELLGAASGMTDQTIVVMGRTIVLPFSDVNIWLSRLGVIMQACTFLLCLRIVTRG